MVSVFLILYSRHVLPHSGEKILPEPRIIIQRVDQDIRKTGRVPLFYGSIVKQFFSFFLSHSLSIIPLFHSLSLSLSHTHSQTRL